MENNLTVKNNRSTKIKDYLEVILVFFLFVQISTGVCCGRIYGGSMSPTIQDGQFCFCAYFDANKDVLKRGDIIVFYPFECKEVLYVKRVIGLPGDRIVAIRDQLYINGEYRETIPGTGTWQSLVSDNHIFVLGDNRANSADSRILGNISIDQLYAKLLIAI